MREHLVIRTPENVAFEHELAALGTRAMAWSIDVVAIVGLILLTSLAVGEGLSRLGGLGMAIHFILIFLIQWGYGAVLEWLLAGRTLGKLLLGLRTVSDRGLRITLLQSAIRNLVRTVDFLPVLYGVGGVAALLDPRCRRLGDLAAGTVVVHERRTPRPSSFLPVSERHNTFASDPAVLVAARRITPPEREILVALCLRRDQLPLGVRHELFEELADHLSQRLHLPRPSFFSAEKFAVQLAAVVLGQSSTATPQRTVRR
ncbi:MAG: RDD family protein [Sandaracinaceae bacterium]|nr:RDD family protein [Sandaracinaceae bacterium]